jgi:aspartyl-tRNA(Asn)/glutamyl-tRNA(Gln) amidotransferase subunit A
VSLHRLTIHQAHELLCQREVSAVELAASVLARIEESDQEIKAYITVTP